MSSRRNVPGSTVDAGSIQEFVNGFLDDAKAQRRAALKIASAATVGTALTYVLQQNRRRAKGVGR